MGSNVDFMEYHIKCFMEFPCHVGKNKKTHWKHHEIPDKILHRNTVEQDITMVITWSTSYSIHSHGVSMENFTFSPWNFLGYKTVISLLFRMANCCTTSLSYRRQTLTKRCVTPIVLYTKVDAQCDKLATDDRRQCITLRVHLSWQHLWRSTCSCEIFLHFRVWNQVPEECTLILKIPHSSSWTISRG